MADTAAHLVDHVLPHAPVRHWVLSFPFCIRFLLASSPRMCAAVVFAQRFGSALNLILHFHALVLDGAFVSPGERSPMASRASTARAACAMSS